MSLTYIFETGTYKGRQIRWVKNNDLNYLKSVMNNNIRLKLTPKIRDFIKKVCKGKVENTSFVIDEVIELYRDGNSKLEIYNGLIKRGYTTSYSNFILDSASGKIKIGFEEEKSYMIGLHLKRYDSTYNKHMGTAATLVGFKGKYKRLEHYILAMDALIAKERLLGLHSNKYNIQLNNFINRDKDQSATSGYNFDLLSTEELVELSALIAEAKVINADDKDINLFNDSMTQTVKVVQDIIEKVEDIEHEEVGSPLSEVHHKDDMGSKIFTQKVKTGNSFEGIEEKIKKSNESAFEKMLKSKISKK